MNNNGCERGIIGFFDILGFKHIANDADIARSARLINETLLSIQSRVEKELQRSELVVSPMITEQLQWLVFSDSIVLWSEIHPEQDFEIYSWFRFLRVCAELMKYMFNAGLPLRGAVASGHFNVREHCFVGKPIVEAYEEANGAEWSGCHLTRSAIDRIKQLWVDPDVRDWRTMMEQVWVPYAIPHKELKTASDSLRIP
jgi:hypothetical protein